MEDVEEEEEELTSFFGFAVVPGTSPISSTSTRAAAGSSPAKC